MNPTVSNDVIYDIETYRNMFSAGIKHVQTGTRWIFEVSDRRDQSRHFYDFIHWLRAMDARMFGFNNEGFDWIVCEHLMAVFAATGSFTALDAYNKAQQIIDSQNSNRFGMMVWPSDRLVKQGDLFKIHHFDNFSKSTSLKKLEIAMRARRVVDLPYSPHVDLDHQQKDEVIAYMCHDMEETERFFVHSADQIRFRDELAAKYPDMGDILNFNDTKIGKKFFERELERITPGSCYYRVDGRRTARQTWRKHIAIADIISQKVQFTRPEFQRVLDWLRSQVLGQQEIDDSLKSHNGGPPLDDDKPVETKGIFKGLSATLDGFQFDFGTGGIHGSIKRQTIRATDTHDLIDVDVASYYPNLAISNRWFPQHLSETFCEIYEQVYQMRQSHPKGTAENAMLKLALNGVYGDSNNKYSPFYDPQYTMSITINGQLYLCMLAESLMALPGTRIVQINTDGLTMLVPKDQRDHFAHRLAAWEVHTGLQLESTDYREMHIRDVNSYIAVTTKGKVKRIGAYAHLTPHDDPYTRERQWHQDHSALVVRKAAEAALVDGVDIPTFIMGHRDPFAFMLSVKVPRSSRLTWGDETIQNTTRFYVSTDGRELIKHMPPLKDKTEWREMSVQKGWKVSICNDAGDFNWSNVNWLYYIEQARKLMI
jgi:hypothetical protein